MTPRKLDVLFACFSYGGNGGLSSEHPCVRDWLLDTIPKAKANERIGRVGLIDLADTPITMTRNRAVKQAIQTGFDVLVMLDSDNQPDLLLGKDPDAVPFFDSSFNFLYDHWDKGPVVVAAPYCGPPPHENVYVFLWTNQQTGDVHGNDCQLAQYTRHEATLMSGIREAAALPTGVCMFDIRAFAITAPKKRGDSPWFYYEWTDLECTEKASTEDVTATRDISIEGMRTLGYNPVFCNWSAWAGHWKPKLVGKPDVLTVESVTTRMLQAAEAGNLWSERLKPVKTSFADELDWSQVPQQQSRREANGQLAGPSAA